MSSLLKQNAVFLHVPKTGGTYFRQIILALNLRHFDFGHEHADMERTLHTFRYYPANAIKSSLLLGKNIDAHVMTCYKFCFVRNPFDWYASYWRFMQDHQWKDFGAQRTKNKLGLPVDNWEPNSLLLQYANADFNGFIESVVKEQPGFLTHLYNQYTPPEHINFVGRHETLQQDICSILSTLGISFHQSLFESIGRVNESRTPKPVWNESLKRKLHLSEQAAFERFGYSEDGTIISTK